MSKHAVFIFSHKKYARTVWVCDYVFVCDQNIKLYWLNVYSSKESALHLKKNTEKIKASGWTIAEIFKQSMGDRNRVGIGFSYRPARLHRLAESISWNRFLGSLKIKNTCSVVSDSLYSVHLVQTYLEYKTMVWTSLKQTKWRAP